MNTEKLKNLSDEDKQEIVKQVNTEVTSIAEEEARTGQKIDVPRGENLVAIMAQELIRCRKQIAEIIPNMSKRAIHRATMAYLDLPTNDVPVYLNTDDEKKLFALGQRAIMARMVVIQHHATKMAIEARVKQELEAKQQLEVSDNGPATTEQ